MPTVVLHPGATIFVTGVNGLIGSHIADRLLKRGYKVRGAVRDVEKTKWLVDYFHRNYESSQFELVGVTDMTIEGCYDDVVNGESCRAFLSPASHKKLTLYGIGIDGFVHVASPLGGFTDATTAISIGIKGGLIALKACAKTLQSNASSSPRPH
jgi:nucleoside-diphosphate-sugar epimerase